MYEENFCNSTKPVDWGLAITLNDDFYVMRKV